MADLSDLFHYWSGDLSVSASGDLLNATSADRSKQRILRRLLTNPGDYIFHSSYGAGLPSYVGTTKDAAKIKALIKGQMKLEDSVSSSTAPSVTVTDITGGISVQISYTVAASGESVTLSFNVSR